MDWPGRIDPAEAAIGRLTATARRLVEASVSANTRRAYAGALRRLGPPTSPSCTTPDAPRRAPRWRSPRRASGRSFNPRYDHDGNGVTCEPGGSTLSHDQESSLDDVGVDMGGGSAPEAEIID